MTFMIESNRN